MKLNLLSKYDDLSKEDLIRQLFKMEGKFEALTQTINNNSNNIIVFPKEFGKEDMEHIKKNWAMSSDHSSNLICSIVSHVYSIKFITTKTFLSIIMSFQLVKDPITP